MLRPEKLLRSKNRIEQDDKIVYPFYDDFEGYEACEFEATQGVVKKEIERGLEIITDGEYSKSMWQYDLG